MSEQLGFYVDTTRCLKCWACVITCKQWNGIEAGGISRRKVEEQNAGSFPHIERVFLSTSCMHCAKPACVDICPAGAITKREEDGIVVVDKEACINCKSCFTACPFGVPEHTDTMDKCDACLGIGRQAGEDPRCVITCPTKALFFGSMADMEAEAAKKGGALMEGSTGPSVYVATRS